MALVKALEEAAATNEVRRPVELVSFENDLDALRLALLHISQFTHLKHAAPAALLRDGRWSSRKAPLAWTLAHGDFQELAPAQPAPDVIWFDPFSAKADTPLWSVDCFAAMLAASAGHDTTLHTYSSSTAVRATMLAAGWFVLRAAGAGTREESTIAASSLGAVALVAGERLGPAWLAKWERSSARRDDFAGALRAHPQFTSN
jgi:queuine tRNA-ribosyltransferase